MRDRYPLDKNYLLCRSNADQSPLSEKRSVYYFVDVKQTSLLLQKHYHLFANAVGHAFHPLEVTLEINDQANSPFWSALQKSKNCHLMLGILFGYGLENATLFQWKFDSKLSLDAKELMADLPTYEVNPYPSRESAKLHGFPFLLPGFASFCEKDPVVDQYQSDRKKIVKMFGDGPVLDITLEKLMAH